MKHLRKFNIIKEEIFMKGDKVVICDSSCINKVRKLYPDASGFSANSALISRLKGLITYRYNDILVIINDTESSDISIQERIDFIKSFVGGVGNYEIKRLSEIE